MRRIVSTAVLLLLLGHVLIECTAKPRKRARDRTCAVKGLQYADAVPNAKHELDLYFPLSVVEGGECWHSPVLTPEVRDLPVVVVWHAGGWLDRSKEEYAPIGVHWAEELDAVIVIPNYRLTPRQLPDPSRAEERAALQHPMHVHDAALAIKWIVEQEEFALNKEALFIGGHCAGGTFAGQLLLGPYLREVGVAPERHVRGAFGWEGIYDIVLLDHDFPGYDEWFLTLVFGDDYYGPSPQYLGAPVSEEQCEGIKWLLMHSPEDTLVNMAQTTTFARHLKDQGYCDVEVNTSLRGDHMAEVEWTAAQRDKRDDSTAARRGGNLVTAMRHWIERVHVRHVDDAASLDIE